MNRMTLAVYFGTNDQMKMRSFHSYREAKQFIEYNERYSTNSFLKKVDLEPIEGNELIRKVYRQENGELRYCILKVVEG